MISVKEIVQDSGYQENRDTFRRDIFELSASGIQIKEIRNGIDGIKYYVDKQIHVQRRAENTCITRIH